MQGLSNEDILFIKNLSNEMKTQDTRATAQPYGLILLQEKEELRPSGFGDGYVAVHDSESYYSFKDLVKGLEDYYGMDNVDLGGATSLYELQDTAEALQYNIDVYAFEKDHVPNKMSSNFFITEKAYHDYIDRDGHNLVKPQSFGIHLTRNSEMENLYKIIHKLADILETEPCKD